MSSVLIVGLVGALLVAVGLVWLVSTRNQGPLPSGESPSLPLESGQSTSGSRLELGTQRLDILVELGRRVVRRAR